MILLATLPSSQQYEDMAAKLETTCHEINRSYNGRVCLRMVPSPDGGTHSPLRIDLEVAAPHSIDLSKQGLVQGVPIDPKAEVTYKI